MKQTKSLVVLFSFIIIVSILPAFVSAQSLPTTPQLTKPISQMTVPELQAKIQEIASAIQQLQVLLYQLTGTTSSNLSQIPLSFTFQSNLKQGQCSQDARYLQIFLNSNPDTVVSVTGPGSTGKETICFGLKTKQALIKYQEKYTQQILAPYNLTRGTGALGPTTRAKINQELLQRTGGGIPTTPATPATPATPTPIVCGNNQKETGETCDGTDLDNFGNGLNKCILYSSSSYESGNLSCSSDCKTIITSNCVQKSISIPTLYVNLTTSLTSSNWSKSISGQSPLTGIDLKADVTGTATGNINYSFDCTNDGTWDSPDTTQYKGITSITKEFTNGCTYLNPGTYTARVKAERNIAPPAYDTVTITVTSSTPVNYSLNILANNGLITKSPNQTSYASGTTVNLTATPNSGYQFTGWSGDIIGTTNPTSVIMNGNKNITANFALITTYSVIVSNVSGNPGATSISVSITLNNIGTREIFGIDIQLNYDSNLITAIDIQKGSLTQSWNLEKNINTAGQMKIALYSSAKLTSGGETAKVIFNVKSTAPAGSISVLTLAKFDVNETAVTSITNGTFTIQSVSGVVSNNNLASSLSAIQEAIGKIQSMISVLSEYFR